MDNLVFDATDTVVEDRLNYDDLVIDETNFDQYFFDTRKHRPKPGQVLACYESFAEFVDGPLKRDVLYLIQNSTKVEAAQRLIQKIARTTYRDSVRILNEMVNDLLAGMSPAQVAEKPYEMLFQAFYYTDYELVPKNDKHWWTTKLLKSDEATLNWNENQAETH